MFEPDSDDMWPNEKWYAISCEWSQNTEKGHVVIAGSINKTFEPSKKLTHRPSDVMELTGRVSVRRFERSGRYTNINKCYHRQGCNTLIFLTELPCYIKFPD